MRSRRLRRPARLILPLCAIGAAIASAQCGLLGAPGEYAGSGTSGDVPDGGSDGTVTTDGTTTSDGNVVLPDGNVIPGSIGTIAILAGERDPTSADDNPAWTGDAWSGIVGPDGRIASWRIDQSATFIGSFETAVVTDGRWFAINTGFGIAGGRAATIQSALWGPGVGGDWKGARVNPPGGLDEHTKAFFGSHVLFVGGTRTFAVDGGTNTFFTREVHAADVDVTASTLGGTANSGIELALARARPAVLVEGTHAYVIGGRSSGGITATVERTTLDIPAGGLGAFSNQPSMTSGGADHRVYAPSAAAGEGFVFVAGGRTNTAGAPSAVVLSAKIGATGDLEAWNTLTPLPAELRDFGFVVFKKRLYVIGGRDAAGARTRDVLSASIAADGTIGAWDAANAKLPAARSDIVTAAY